MGEAFEDICYDFFERLNKEGKLPGLALSYGRWWGNNPIEKREEEIDLIAEGKDFSIFGEFKWRNRDFDMQELEKLVSKSEISPVDKTKPYYLIITKKDFSKDLKKEIERNERVLGYSFDRDF